MNIEVPTVAVDAAAIRRWITAPDAGQRAEEAAGITADERQQWGLSFWTQEYVGESAVDHGVYTDETWLEDLFRNVRSSPGLFGEARARGWLVYDEGSAVKDQIAIVGVEATGPSGHTVLLVDEVGIWNLILPAPDGCTTDATVTILERLGQKLSSIVDQIS